MPRPLHLLPILLAVSLVAYGEDDSVSDANRSVFEDHDAPRPKPQPAASEPPVAPAVSVEPAATPAPTVVVPSPSVTPAPVPPSATKIPEWYAKQCAGLANPGTHLGGMLEKVESWLDMAEANPAATVSFPPENPKAKDAKPRVFPAKQLAEQGTVKLRQSFGSPPQGALLPERVEIAWARVALMENHPEIAVKTLLPYDIKDISSATPERKEALVWLTTARLRLLVTDAQPMSKKTADPTALADWFGLPIDWAAGAPVLGQGDGKSTPSNRVQALLETADSLVAATEGSAQVRAAMTVGDAFGLLGKWGDAINSYGFVIGQTGYINYQASTYSIEDGNKPKRAVPGNLPNEAKAKQALAGRIAELIRYSAEFILYRDGHWQMLNGQYQNAIGTFEKLLAVADKKRDESLAKAIADAVNEAKKAKQPIDKSQKDAETKWRASTDKNGLSASPFEAAARVYAEKCRIALGDPKNEAQGIRNLEQFIKEDPDGLYRGEALQIIATCAMDHFAFQTAGTWLEKWDAWTKQAREKMGKEKWNFAEKLPGIAETAGPLTQAPHEQYNKPDFWGKVSQVAIQPSQIVCERNCPWYLDALEADCAKYRGLLSMMKGDSKGALEQWRRILKLDPATSEEDPIAHPNDFTRLKFGADKGYLYASPDDLRLYSGQLRNAVLLADFYYITQKFGKAESVAHHLLAGKAGHLSPAQMDYPRYLIGTMRYWQGDKKGAMEAYAKVYTGRDGTPSEIRALYAAGNVGLGSHDKILREEGKKLLREIVRHAPSGEWLAKAYIALATDYRVCDHDSRKAMDLLGKYPGPKEDRWTKLVLYMKKDCEQETKQ